MDPREDEVSRGDRVVLFSRVRLDVGCIFGCTLDRCLRLLGAAPEVIDSFPQNADEECTEVLWLEHLVVA